MSATPPSAPPTPEWSTADDAALKHAWDWFTLHAAQRMQVLSFFFVSLALTVAGYGAALQAGIQAVAGALAAAGVLICVGFLFLEIRTRQLCRACEPALAAIESRLTTTNSAGTDVGFVPSVEVPVIRRASYSTIIRSLIAGSALMLAGGAVYAFSVEKAQPDSASCTGSFTPTRDSVQYRRLPRQTEFAVVCEQRPR